MTVPSAVWSLVVLAALAVLFVAGVRIATAPTGWRRHVVRAGVVAAALVATFAANVALYRHDVHWDVTRVHSFTPSPDARRVVESLANDVAITYFYQKQDPASRAARTMLEILGRSSRHLAVRAVDADQNPGLAGRLGVRGYNVAVLESGGRRLHVMTTDERDVALAILRVTRASTKTICFGTGHGQYDVDNFEYHTHFEGVQRHSHGAEGAAVVLMEQHGAGRLRRALDALGFSVRKVVVATAGRVPEDCAAFVEVGPRTPYTPREVDALRAYLAAGGSALLLLDIDFVVDERLRRVLADAGVAVGDGVVVDPLDHYFTDEQMVAVLRYVTHPITRGLALSFYPGARPVDVVSAPRATSRALFASSTESYVRPLGPGRDTASRRGARPLAVAAEGRLGDAVSEFRLVVVGDADFASNSFFPYMSNGDVTLATVAWLVREERAPTLKPPVEVLPKVTLTERDVRSIFLLTVVALPAAVVGAGTFVWWRRRR